MNTGWRKFIFCLVSLGSLGAGIHFSFLVIEPNSTMAGTWLTFSLVTFLFGWPEKIESISFLGNNIKLREVKNAINELKQVAAVFFGPFLEFIQISDRWGGFPEEQRLEVYDSIDNILSGLGFAPQEKEKIQSRWHYWIERDYINGILNIGNVHHPEVPNEKKDEWVKRKNELGSQIPFLQPDDLRNLFREFEAYSNVVNQLIDDFEYYKKNKQHRDSERWKQRNHWF